LNSSIAVTTRPEERHGVSFREAFWVWLRVAALSFGGPAGQIAVMHRILVEEKRWIGETRFLHALNYCMLLPGPEAQQLAVYIGWLLHRIPGGLVAGSRHSLHPAGLYQPDGAELALCRLRRNRINTSIVFRA
jgi:chromate transporter